ncbi:hypothetical protein HXX76_012139 [Chlamydomonas incerta]|uniref:MATH domain-containing protein n=1 Tax=Chlamydomonas incerta TaxID=51695 RepID=A0A835SLK4_CHLIN|nr:hypothetical protein HXX76_012139 [Chlamydomonas incerta]|eukprot:KAG2427816.1 hypothetical protein HXX76_012139 [Chlamydomonas incerta]
MLEWRSRSALDVAETSSTFLDDEDDGPKPHELYGKFTWKIENFSEISKRELRSNVFDVGSYKWYILVYPQGCDVCNHLSLFLCVADYDKLLPGWSHFAQFTIAVVNKDPKKSKYSDTLHRFCKKEHDWGWKKFMELSKVLDGFTVADTLVIKAQVQVILDKPSKPFRCLDPQYRRELVRVYLTNVEGICRRFCDDKKARLSWVREEGSAFRHFWASLTPEQQRKYLTDKGEVILKAVVKQFFNEKEVTSTLVMDALYSGCKQIEEHSRTWLEGKCSDNAPVVLIKAERNSFTLCGDLMEIADRVLKDYIPAAKDDNNKQAMQPNDGLTLRSGQDGDDYRRDSIERDEKRLAELGRKTIEMFVIAHIFCEKLEIAYREAEALKRQDQLIAEEFEMARLEESKAQAKAMADKEKKAKKKEKLKQKKEAEKLKREAEEAERKAREEELRRQEAERKAKDAEKKRLEDAQAQPQAQPQQAQQQPHQQQARKAGKAKDDKKALQQQQQQQQLQQQQLQQQQQVKAKPAAQPQQQQQQASSRSAAAATSSGPPSLSSIAAAAVGDSSASAASASSLPERPGAHEGPSSDSGSEEVGTVNQATGAEESSGDGEEEVEVLAASRGMAAAAASDSDGDSEGRAALEEEVTILRAQVSQLQRVLAERDAEVYTLRGQLADSHLAQAHLAQQLTEALAKEAPVASSNARVRGANASSSGSATADGSSGSAGREAVGSDGSSSAASAAARPDTDRGQGKSDAAANGPKEGLSTSAMPAAAGAAARRMQGNAAAPSAAQSHDAAVHHSAASRSAAPGAAAPGGRGGPTGASGSTAAADLGSAGPMMQRSTSATLPSAAPSSATGMAQYAPVQLAAATANGRARDAAGASGTSAGASSAAGAGAKSFLPAGVSASASASGAASSAATSNGISGVLHSSSGATAAPAQDGLPSYRNAAAGVLASGQPSGSAGAPAMVSVSTTPIIPASASAAVAAAAAAQNKRAEEGASATAAAAARLGVSAPSTDGFSATNARIIMQQAQQRTSSMAFSTPTPVPSSAAKQRMTASTQLDSPGLEDFAHINMIDDLLTE